MVRWMQHEAHTVLVECGGGDEDADAWHGFQLHSLGTEALNASLGPKKRVLSLAETYFALAETQWLQLREAETLQQLWESFSIESPQFQALFVLQLHFRRLQWRLKSGLNYGAHYVLYRGPVNEVHSEYIAYLQSDAQPLAWVTLQALTRVAADVKKTLLLCQVTQEEDIETMALTPKTEFLRGVYCIHGRTYTLQVSAMRFWDPTATSFVFQPQPTVRKKGRTKGNAKR